MNKQKQLIWTLSGHISFWVLSFVVLMLIFKDSGPITSIDFVYTSIFHFTLIPLVSINYYFGAPKFLLHQKTIAYLLFLLPSIAIFSLANQLLFDQYADVIFPGYYFVSGFSLREVIIIHFLYLLTSTLILLSGSWFRENEQKKKLIELEKEKIQAELQMLKNQVNPHFFFNTLQNLFALSLKKADELPDMILKLSDLMRYVIYDSNVPKIKITKEITFIKNYLELQKLRITSKTKFQFEVKGESFEKEIPPLLLIPFIENCFKHGLKGKVNNAFAAISLEFDENHLIFKTRNNKGQSVKSEMDQSSGVGIENVKRRLDLNFPERYDLNITEDDSIYEVYLKIDLS